MSGSLTDTQLQQYERDGVLFPIPVLSSEEASRYLQFSNELEAHFGEHPTPAEMNQMQVHFRWAYDLVPHPKVLDAVEGVLGPNIVAWACALFSKGPHTAHFTSWHQDGTYWNLASTQVATAWIALSKSSVANGCMRVVPGSQTMDIQQHADTYVADNLHSRGQEIEVDVDEADAVNVVLQPGEMSLHHVRIIHGSNCNGSDEKRVGYVIRYVTPEVRQHGARLQAILARGQDDFDHFDFVDPPLPDRDFAGAVEDMKESARQAVASVMQDSSAT